MHRPYRDNPSTHADNLTESDIKYEGRKPPCQCYQRNRSGHSYISQHVLLTVLDGWATDDGQTGTVWTLSFHLVWEKTSPISNHGQTLRGYSSRTTNSELTINIRSGNGHCRWMTSATSVQFNSVPRPISLLGVGGVGGEAWDTIQQRFCSSLFCGRPSWAVLVRAGMSSLWGCTYSISSADHETHRDMSVLDRPAPDHAALRQVSWHDKHGFQHFWVAVWTMDSSFKTRRGEHP